MLHSNSLLQKVLNDPIIARSARLARPTIATETRPHCAQWLKEMFPDSFTFDFSDKQLEILDWFTEIEIDNVPEPLVGVLPRGAGKTSILDGGTSYLLAHKTRMGILFISANLDKARDRVNSVRSLLGTEKFRSRYPLVSEPLMVGNQGFHQAWNNRLLLNEAGQLVVGASLSGENRGLNQNCGGRIDFFGGDDLDKPFDSEEMTKRRVKNLTADIFPMRGPKRRPAVCLIQNLIKDDGMIDQQVKGSADWLKNRRLVGPVPALLDFEYKENIEMVTVEGSSVPKTTFLITRGIPTWEGQDLRKCQEMIDDTGPSTFMQEQQHDVADIAGALLSSHHFKYTQEGFDLSCISKKVVGVDPAGGATWCGIVAVGRILIDKQVMYCVLEDASVRTDIDLDDDWADTAVLTAYQWGASLEVETNFGGRMCIDPLKAAIKKLRRQERIGNKSIKIHGTHATMDKKLRALDWQKAHKDGLVLYLHKCKNGVYKASDRNHFTKLKGEWCTWVKGESKGSPNRLDAQVHGFRAIKINRKRKVRNIGSRPWIA